MNKKRYRIYYHGEGPSEEDPFGYIMSPEEITHHLEKLPMTLKLFFHDKIEVETAPAPQEEGGGLYVTLSADELDNLLNKCIGDTNCATPGLFFRIQRIAD